VFRLDDQVGSVGKRGCGFRRTCQWKLKALWRNPHHRFFLMFTCSRSFPIPPVVLDWPLPHLSQILFAAPLCRNSNDTAPPQRHTLIPPSTFLYSSLTASLLVA